MSIEEFIGLFDKKKITEGKIRFTFLPPKGFPCKYWCENGTDADSLLESILASEVNNYEIIGVEETHFDARYDCVVVIVKLVFKKEQSK